MNTMDENRKHVVWDATRPGRPAHPTVADGLIAGALAAALVAVFFAVVNALFGEPILQTVAALGTVLFEWTMPLVGPPTYSWGVILGYTAVHFATFMAIGAAIAAIFRFVARQPSLGALAVIVIAITLTPFVATTWLFAWATGGLLRGWELGVANVLAAGLIIGYVFLRSPELRRQTREGSWFTTTTATDSGRRSVSSERLDEPLTP